MFVPLTEAGVPFVLGWVRVTVDSNGVRVRNPSCRGGAWCCCRCCGCCCCRCRGWLGVGRGRGWWHGWRTLCHSRGRVRLWGGRRCRGGLLHKELGNRIDNRLQLLRPSTSSLQLHKQIGQDLSLASGIGCRCRGRRCRWSHCSRWTVRLRCGFGRRFCLCWRRSSWTGRVRWWPLEKHR